MNEKQRRERAAQLRAVLESDLKQLGALILATPTSPERNRYCDAQIHLRTAMEQLA